MILTGFCHKWGAKFFITLDGPEWMNWNVMSELYIKKDFHEIHNVFRVNVGDQNTRDDECYTVNPPEGRVSYLTARIDLAPCLRTAFVLLHSALIATGTNSLNSLWTETQTMGPQWAERGERKGEERRGNARERVGDTHIHKHKPTCMHTSSYIWWYTII